MLSFSKNLYRQAANCDILLGAINFKRCDMLDNFKEEVIVKRNKGFNSLMYGL